MRNIKLTIRYDGTNYAGWQFQKNAKSIQAAIESALKKLLRQNKVRLIGASRTDSGAHAKGQIANFKTNALLPLENIQKALNSILPKDIVISNIEEAAWNFNSQYDAKAKLYSYTISIGDFIDPFLRRFAMQCRYRLNIRSTQRAAGCLIGRHDFKSFQTKDVKERDAVRRIKNIKIEKEKNLVYIYIEADGFLYNMARNIVGTLIEVGRGRISEDRMKEILSKKERAFSGPTAPAKGLCLLKVRY